MRFFDLLTLVMALLQWEGRVSYRALKLEFALDDEHLEALQDERWMRREGSQGTATTSSAARKSN